MGPMLPQMDAPSPIPIGWQLAEQLEHVIAGSQG
jgi:hypothetical protein